MVRRPPIAGEKRLHWVGSCKRDFLAFPAPVQSDMGYALGLAQLGGKHPKAKPWKGEGPAVFEVVENFDEDTFRAVYTAPFEGFGACLPEEEPVRRSERDGRCRAHPRAPEARARAL
jgi:hypothetical protein